MDALFCFWKAKVGSWHSVSMCFLRAVLTETGDQTTIALRDFVIGDRHMHGAVTADQNNHLAGAGDRCIQ